MGANGTILGNARRLLGSRSAQLLLALAYLGVKVTSPWNPLPISSGDGETWAGIAKRPLFSSEFWLAKRPFTLPLLYKIAGGSEPRLIWFQLMLGLGSWLLLADALGRLAPSPPLAVLVFALTLLLALTTNVHAWDIVIRSESLGLSLIVLSLAALLRFLIETGSSRRRWVWVGLSVVTGALATFARETNGYLLPLLAVLVLVARWPLRARTTRVNADWQAVVLATGLVLASLACQANTRASKRFDFPLMNVIFVRVLPNRARLAYFEQALAMPVTPRLVARGGALPPWHSAAFVRAQDTRRLREWIWEDGYRGYQRYLLSHFPDTAREAFRSFGLAATESMTQVAPSATRAARHARNVVSPIADRVWLKNPAARRPYASWVGLFVLALAGLLSRKASARLPALALLTLLFASGTQAYICLHADAMEVARHSLVVGLLLRLAWLPGAVLVLLGASWALAWVRHRAAVKSPNTPGKLSQSEAVPDTRHR